MAKDIAQQLFESGRGHALASDFLFRSAIREGEDRNVADPEAFAFNGPYSLSTHYLLGLGLELMLKAAIVACGGPSDDKFLREIGHDLVEAFEVAQTYGFRSEAPRLRAILDVMREPYKAHWLRYSRPDQFGLPGDFVQVVEALEALDAEVQARLGRAK